MKWKIIEAYPLWFQWAIPCLLILDIFLVYQFFKKKNENLWELSSRILGSNFFALYLIYRIVAKIHDAIYFPQFQTWYSWLQWFLIVLPFGIFFWSYLYRKAAIQSANRFREIVFPFFCALLPAGVYESSLLIHSGWISKTSELRFWLKPFYPGGPEFYEISSFLFIFLGDFIAVWALIYLRRSFSIMTEVRDWIHQGPYRWVRHPMYLGEILATLGFCLMRFSFFNILLTLLFIFCLALRAKFEEAKIKTVYSDYDEYSRKTGFLFPRIW